MSNKRAGSKESEDGERKRSIFKSTVLCIFEGPRTKDQDHGRRLGNWGCQESSDWVRTERWGPMGGCQGGSLRGATVIGDVHQRHVVE